MKVFLGILTVAAFGVALFACGSSDENSAPAQATKRPLGAGNTTTANSELEQAVRASLDSDKQLKAAGLVVSADVTRNQVTLSGTVASEELRAKAVELAKTAHAGVIVSDRLTVR